MAFLPLLNNVATTLRAAHSVNDGVLQVVTGKGDSFGTDFPIRVTCQRKSDKSCTIYKVASRSGDDLTIDSAIEGTSDQSFAVGDLCEMRLTAGALTDIHDAINGILNPYQDPVFTSFAITGASTQEVGATFSGTKTFTWATSNSGNVAANSITIADTTASSTLVAGTANDGSQAVAVSVTHASPATHTWTITGTNTESATFTATTTIAWNWRVYYGVSAGTTLDEGGIESLANSLLTTTALRTYALAGAGYKYVAFPDSFGGPSGFRDNATLLSVAMCDLTDDAAYSHVENGFSYALVTVTNANGVATPYRVYRSKNFLNSDLTMVVS